LPSLRAPSSSARFNVAQADQSRAPSKAETGFKSK
jgi:hypothetical protein